MYLKRLSKNNDEMMRLSFRQEEGIRVQRLLNDILSGTSDVVIDAVKNYIDETVNISITKERNNGIKITTETLIEAGIKDAVIVNLLVKYWGLLDEEAREAVRTIKTIEYPYKALAFS